MGGILRPQQTIATPLADHERRLGALEAQANPVQTTIGDATVVSTNYTIPTIEGPVSGAAVANWSQGRPASALVLGIATAMSPVVVNPPQCYVGLEVINTDTGATVKRGNYVLVTINFTLSSGTFTTYSLEIPVVAAVVLNTLPAGNYQARWWGAQSGSAWGLVGSQTIVIPIGI